MTKRQVHNILQDWQQKLRLENWEISVELLPAEELGDDGRVAQVRSRPCYMRADIEVANEQDDVEIEASILHELLHIVLSEMREELSEGKQFMRTEPWNLREEQAVHRLETCIMATKEVNE